MAISGQPLLLHLQQHAGMPMADPVADSAPGCGKASSSWADLPHDLLVRIFAAQPEPLHNLGAEFACRAWAKAVSALRIPSRKTTQSVSMSALRVCNC